MDAKKSLARYIVKDFHSEVEANKAGEDWARQFQKHGVPEELDCVDVPLAKVAVGGLHQVAAGHSSNANKRPIRLQKLVPLAGLAASNTEAVALYKRGAVELFDLNTRPFDVHGMVIWLPINEFLVLRVGKRMKRVRIVDSTENR